jgi:hypothetical protein
MPAGRPDGVVRKVSVAGATPVVVSLVVRSVAGSYAKLRVPVPSITVSVRPARS